MIKQFFWSALAVAILGVFIIVYLSPRPRLATEQTLRDHDHIFDFIIIGAGTAGCVIASELARRGNFSVLLIEEGGLSNYGPLSLQTIPLFAPDNNVFGGIDYEYHLDPQSSPLKGDVAPGNPARRINSPRGRVLGGSGELNFMMHVRPSRGDYDSWVELSGDSSWGYENMHQLEERLEIRGDQHKDVGVHVETPVEHPLVGTLMAGAGMTEWGNSSHYNFGARRGGGRTEYSTKKGTRASTVRGYLLPTLKTHPNLHALVQTKVLRILFHQGKVTGVEVLHNKKKVIIKAAKEVVLSSGTYASPQLLLLSGIGPKEELRKVGIDSVVDLPAVGKHMEDHPGVLLKVRLGPELGAWWPMTVTLLNLLGDPMNFINYAFHGTGPLSSAAADFTWFGSTDPSYEASPDLQFVALLSAFDAHIFEMFALFAPGTFVENVGNWADYSPFGQGFVSGVILLHAQTRGQVQLVSSDPSKHPKITYDAYKEDADVNRLIQGIRIAQALLNTSAVQSLQPQVLFHRLLEKEFGKDTDEYWTEYMRRFGQTLYHPVGTCRMGAANDGSSVVDSQLRVWGVQGLRVADASVMPRISSGNTNIPTALIGLKLVDTLLKEYA